MADPHAPPVVREVAQALEAEGHATWAVGGAVRDALLGITGSDWDLATAARPKDVRRIFRRTVPLGVEHGTVGVLADDGSMLEVTTFRQDVETTGRHAVVRFADRIEDDLARRDFTINAIAWHPVREEIVDPFEGRADLRAGVLRTVGAPRDRFAEDYLRILRALRFAGRFDLAIDPSTWRALVDARASVEGLSAERVREELMKVLGHPRPSGALSLYAASRVLEHVAPPLAEVVALEEELAPAESPWTEALLAVDALSQDRATLRLAALLSPIGRPGARTRNLRGGWRFTGHEAIAGRAGRDLLRRLRFSNAEIESIGDLLALQEDLFPPDSDGARVRRWLRRVGPDRVPDLFRLRAARLRATAARPDGAQSHEDLVTRWRMARLVLRARPPLEVADLALDGSDLIAMGLAPGPDFGRILEGLLEVVLEDPSANRADTLRALVRERLP
ncbi:MAG TPA: CCA tRNA nucleotidyltransferase [Longimicrobiales bacterium]|nr:CCA tRNA nucleotidyltransferase [Longimicrobiales bacterium]